MLLTWGSLPCREGQFVYSLGSRNTYKAWIIIGCARSLHAAQSSAFDTRKDAVFTNEPIGVLRILILNLLLDHDAKDVVHMLIQSARLTEIVEGAGVLGDSVRELVTNSSTTSQVV